MSNQEEKKRYRASVYLMGASDKGGAIWLTYDDCIDKVKTMAEVYASSHLLSGESLIDIYENKKVYPEFEWVHLESYSILI